MSDDDRKIVLDTLKRCRRILGDAILLESSAASWDCITSDEPFLADSGPVWEGLPGTHPMLPMIQVSIELLKNKC